jgi:hypothetical protein
MSSTTYSLSLARSENGNWSLEPSANLLRHPLHELPPMAFPADMLPSQAQDYAASMLPLAHVPAPAELIWHVYGRTVSASGVRQDAYRASWSVSVQSLSPRM